MIKSDLFDGIPTISELQALVKEKDEIEKEISQLRNYLNSTKYGIHGSLVDKEGYPIGDTETIIEVRTARHRLAVLNTDHSNLMKRIEVGLELLHLSTRDQYTSNENSDTKKNDTNTT